jgi:hypothetical protein
MLRLVFYERFWCFVGSESENDETTVASLLSYLQSELGRGRERKLAIENNGGKHVTQRPLAIFASENQRRQTVRSAQVVAGK